MIEANTNILAAVRYQLSYAWNRFTDVFDWWLDLEIYDEAPYIAHILLMFVALIVFGIAYRIIARFFHKC